MPSIDEGEYRVEWSIDVSASNPEEAALKARRMQLDPESTATVYTVTHTLSGHQRDVDTHRVQLVRYMRQFIADLMAQEP